MRNQFSRLIRTCVRRLRSNSGPSYELDNIKLNQGLILSKMNSTASHTNLQDYEFRIFSQWGDDGIIQHLTESVRIKNKTFIEFGVQDFSESNCRFLMLKDNWSGYVIDGSPQHIANLRTSWYYWRYDLQSHAAFITRDNVVVLLDGSGFAKDAGIVSIDIDGNDYWVLSVLTMWTPSIFIVEYNAVFGKDRSITVPYDPDFMRSRAHFSNLYFGASLSALDGLLSPRGYAFVGTNSAGVNAFWVRRELLNDHVKEVSVDEGFTMSRARESRDADDQLSFLRDVERVALIKDMPVYDTRLDAIGIL